MTSYNNINNKYILKLIFDILPKRKSFDIIHYTKHIQNKIEISLIDYILFSQIEIEIIINPDLCNKKENFFINYNEENKKYFHIFFNGDKSNEIDRNYFYPDEKNISKINVVIDYKVTSLKELFKDCICLKEINFIRFNRKNITVIYLVDVNLYQILI